MKITQLLTTAMILGTFTLSIVGNASARGPMSMANFDKDGNGTITEQEFNNGRAQQQEEMKASGRAGRGMANALSFPDADSDKNGVLSATEVKSMQGKQQSNRGNGRGKGKGQGNRG